MASFDQDPELLLKEILLWISLELEFRLEFSLTCGCTARILYVQSALIEVEEE